jgi:hypothetical protein
MFLLVVGVTLLGFVFKLDWKIKLIIIGLVLLLGGPGLNNMTLLYQETFKSGNNFGQVFVNDLVVIGTSYKGWDRLTEELAPVYKPLTQYTDNLTGNGSSTSKQYLNYSTSNMWIVPLAIELYILICLTWLIEFALKGFLGKKSAPDEKEAEVFLWSLLISIFLGMLMTWGFPGIRTLISAMFF